MDESQTSHQKDKGRILQGDTDSGHMWILWEQRKINESAFPPETAGLSSSQKKKWSM